MPNSEKKVPANRILALGSFLILFGLVLGAITFVTVIGPIIGLVLMGFGVYIIWTSSTGGNPREPLA